MRPSRPVEERFWEKVDKSGDCWVWTASRNASGYGQFQMGGPNVAHRVAWILANGPIPKGLFVLHSCDNRACVRIDHLRLGTPKENGHDQVLRDRKPKSYDYLVPINGAAIMLGIRTDTLRQQIHRGRVAGFKSAIWHIRKSEIERYRRESLGKRKPGVRK